MQTSQGGARAAAGGMMQDGDGQSGSRLAAQIDKMPPEQKKQVADFVKFLNQQQGGVIRKA